MILFCLMEYLYMEKMVEDCEYCFLELQYFIFWDWKLDFVLYCKCQGDVFCFCYIYGWNEISEFMFQGVVFFCLYRYVYCIEEQGRRFLWEC